MAKSNEITINETWSGMVEELNANSGKDLLLLGLKSKCSGRVKEDQESENSVQFTLDIDWSKCTFEHLVSLAMRTVRIDAQGKFRAEGIPFEDGAILPISVSKKTVKGEPTPEGLMKKLEVMNPEQQAKVIEMIKAKVALNS